ncbi:conserved exported hypothetical protein [Paraburkholderia ribeironis]|uniref:Uncharacterized protein TP-0789 domain-containing protein n=1 Tax=Paraburkholderia ribeironis TaxID=1247936 RepID=A0A1N7S737_9BURK|nr:outer membrane lipoprotein-sorting protein [Paraburkholderia ribeironis]SIT43214.1 conserved exported hypothetical protein [Paraburkholderia ribeironis]
MINKLRVVGILLACLFVGAVSSVSAAEATPDAGDLLKKSDVARGGGLPGVYWSVTLHSVDGDKTDDQGLTVKADTDNSLAEFVSPANLADQKLLMAGRNMWFIRSGLRKPVPISPRQRLLGQASNGDIAATNYAKDYNATLAGDEVIDGDPSYKLQLSARDEQVTYPRIDYWISARSGLAKKADFYSVSGRVIKSAQFEYSNAVEYQGKKIPFVSRMVIQDRINSAQKTTLEYSNVVAKELPQRTFDINFLTN